MCMYVPRWRNGDNRACPAGSSFSQQWVAYQEEQAAETQVKTLHRLIQRAYPVLHAYSQELGYLNEHVRCACACATGGVTHNGGPPGRSSDGASVAFAGCISWLLKVQQRARKLPSGHSSSLG